MIPAAALLSSPVDCRIKTRRYHSEIALLVEAISAEELCECLGISRRTLGDWMRKKVVPYEKIGGRVLFDVADVDRALRRFRIKAIGD
jgi:excisionase family DNA binding protein